MSRQPGRAGRVIRRTSAATVEEAAEAAALEGAAGHLALGAATAVVPAGAGMAAVALVIVDDVLGGRVDAAPVLLLRQQAAGADREHGRGDAADDHLTRAHPAFDRLDRLDRGGVLRRLA